MSLFSQKIKIFSSILLINILLSSLFIIYSHRWYAFIPILGFSPLLSSISVLLLWGNRMIYGKDNRKIFRNNKNSYVYIVPTFNESYDEIKTTIDSLSEQILTEKDNKMMIIICDGKIRGKGNNKNTDRILIEDILNNNISQKKQFKNAYITWDNKTNNLDIYDGKYNNLNYMLIVKHENYGKRDGLVLLRRLLYCYNENIINHPLIQDEFLNYFNNLINEYFYEKIDYIIGTDADTVFEKDCTNELIKGIQKRSNIVGTVGFVNISPNCKKFSPFTLYQYGEYVYAQCLKRQQQSEITHKVSCLSGCVQILKICGETCGDKILSKFNMKPEESSNIIKHIRSYASEDRNHVCLMLSEYPNVETTQTLYANAYTKIPESFDVLLSQRRRWSLGATSNDLLLLTSPGIILYEKISAFANILTFILSPFILVATIVFIKTIITSPSILMLYLAIIILIPFTYALTIPLFVKQMTFREGLYYIFSYIFYVITNSIMNIILYTYSLLNMDKLTWGKTRKIEKINNIDKRKEYVDKQTQTDFGYYTLINIDNKISESDI
jgi:chitin synthase